MLSYQECKYLIQDWFREYNKVRASLTKRELFAVNAPVCPDWFTRKWAIENGSNVDYYKCFLDEFADPCPVMHQNILPAGEMALMKAWQYFYADNMLK